MASRASIERIRSWIHQLKAWQDNMGDPSADPLVEGLYCDFELTFPTVEPRVYRPVNWQQLVNKHCRKDINVCPMCGSIMRLRQNSKSGGQFYGCTLYPGCRGTRDKDKGINLSRELQEFLLAREDNKSSPVEATSRFDMIDEE